MRGKGGDRRSACLPRGNLIVVGRDTYGDGWNGAKLSIAGTDNSSYLTAWRGPLSSDKKKSVNVSIHSQHNWVEFRSPAGPPGPRGITGAADEHSQKDVSALKNKLITAENKLVKLQNQVAKVIKNVTF